MRNKSLIALSLLMAGMSLVGCGKDDKSSSPTHTHAFGEFEYNATEHWKTCTDATCSEKSEKAAHTLTKVSSAEKTCDHPDQETYRCTVCGYQVTKNIGSEVKEHTYVPQITKVANCVTPGEITFICSDCHDSFKQPYTNPEAHEFDAGEVAAGITTYHCIHPGCEKVKTTVDAKTKTTADVSNEALKSAGEIELKEASIAFDEHTLSNLGDEDVSIAAEPVSIDSVAEELGEGLSEEIKEKIGNNKIIDFSLEVGDEKVSTFAGEVTVSVPYELKDNETAEGLVAWYLNEGEPIPMEAKLNNGIVSFKTTHFSYYTIVHLTPEEVCQTFGHAFYAGKRSESTCTTHGYNDQVCSRCGATHRVELPLIEHEYEILEKVEATASLDGHIIYECKHCHDVKTIVLEHYAADGRGFYFNLLRSLVTTDYSIKGNAVLGGEENNIDLAVGRNNNQLFVYGNVSDEEVYILDGYVNTLDSLRGDEMPEMVASIITNIGELIDTIPVGVGEYIEDLGTFLENALFTKKTTNEGYELSFSKEKVEHLLDIVENKKIGEVLNELFAKDVVKKVDNLVEKVYSSTVSEFLDYLKNDLHLDANEILKAARKILEILQIEFELPEKIESLISEEMMKEKVLTLLGSFIPSEVSLMIPETKDGALEMIHQFLDVSALDLVEMFTGENIKDSFKNIAEMITSMLDSIALSIQTDGSGKLLGVKILITALDIPNEGKVSLSISVSKGINNKEEIIARCASHLEKVLKTRKAFTFDEHNAEVIINKAKQVFPGTDFEYLDHFGQDENKKVIISKTDVTYNDKTGKVFIVIKDDQYYSSYYNRYGLGTKVKQGEFVTVAWMQDLVDAYFIPNESAIDYYSESRIYEINYSYLIYDYVTDQFSYSETNLYNFLSYRYRQSYLVSQEEYEAATFGSKINNSPMSNIPTKTYYVKNVDQFSGQISYEAVSCPDTSFKQGVRLYSSSYYIDREMNDEALANIEMFDLDTFIEDGKLSVRPWRVASESETLTAGNASISSIVSDTNVACIKRVSWKITVNGVTKLSGVYLNHISSEYETVEVSSTSGCYTYTIIGHKCDCCHEIYFSGFDVSDNHNYEVVMSVPPTKTQVGYTISKCRDCGELNCTSHRACNHSWFASHYNPETDEYSYYCYDCGANVDQSKPFEIESLGVDSSTGNLKYGFLLYFVYEYEIREIVTFNSYVCYYGVDSEGNSVFSEHKIGADFQIEIVDIEYQDGQKSYSWGIAEDNYYFLINQEELTALQNDFQLEDHDGVDMELSIIITNPFNGSIIVIPLP